MADQTNRPKRNRRTSTKGAANNNRVKAVASPSDAELLETAPATETIPAVTDDLVTDQEVTTAEVPEKSADEVALAAAIAPDQVELNEDQLDPVITDVVDQVPVATDDLGSELAAQPEQAADDQPAVTAEVIAEPEIEIEDAKPADLVLTEPIKDVAPTKNIDRMLGITRDDEVELTETQVVAPEVADPVTDLGDDIVVDKPVAATTVAGAAAAVKKSAKSAFELRSNQRELASNAKQANLRLTHIDPWTVMKMAFPTSIALGIISVVATGLIWLIFSWVGLWDSIGELVGDLQLTQILSFWRVLGFTLLAAVLNTVLFTAAATLAAFMYNLIADLVGGVQMTMQQDD